MERLAKLLKSRVRRPIYNPEDSMDLANKIVTRLPLEELWRDGVTLAGQRGPMLTCDDVASSLRLGLVQFVIADIGERLNWIDFDDCYQFWKTEVKVHLAAPRSKVVLDSFPDSYCYFAFGWKSEQADQAIILLEKHH